MYKLIQEKTFDNFIVEISPEFLRVSKTSFYLAREVERLAVIEGIFELENENNTIPLAFLESKIEDFISSMLIDNGLMPVRVGLMLNSLEEENLFICSEPTDISTKRILNLLHDDPKKALSYLFSKIFMHCFEYSIEISNEEKVCSGIVKHLYFKLENKDECGA